MEGSRAGRAARRRVPRRARAQGRAGEVDRGTRGADPREAGRIELRERRLRLAAPPRHGDDAATFRPAAGRRQARSVSGARAGAQRAGERRCRFHDHDDGRRGAVHREGRSSRARRHEPGALAAISRHADHGGKRLSGISGRRLVRARRAGRNARRCAYALEPARQRGLRRRGCRAADRQSGLRAARRNRSRLHGFFHQGYRAIPSPRRGYGTEGRLSRRARGATSRHSATTSRCRRRATRGRRCATRRSSATRSGSRTISSSISTPITTRRVHGPRSSIS